MKRITTVVKNYTYDDQNRIVRQTETCIETDDEDDEVKPEDTVVPEEPAA